MSSNMTTMTERNNIEDMLFIIPVMMVVVLCLVAAHVTDTLAGLLQDNLVRRAA